LSNFGQGFQGVEAWLTGIILAWGFRRGALQGFGGRDRRLIARRNRDTRLTRLAFAISHPPPWVVEWGGLSTDLRSTCHGHQRVVTTVLNLSGYASSAARLWPILEHGHLTPIASLSAKHCQRTGRVLRITIDEEGWCFHSLTTSQITSDSERNFPDPPRSMPIGSPPIASTACCGVNADVDGSQLQKSLEQIL